MVAGIMALRADELKDISARTGFNLLFLTKDYYVTLILSLLSGLDGIYFKGGTALQKVFLAHRRLSEDIDFTVTADLGRVRAAIEGRLAAAGLFGSMTEGRHVQGFLRLHAPYTDPFGQEGAVSIDLNRRASLMLPPETHTVGNFYHMRFHVATLHPRELVAEKVHALIHRNQPRDYFDVYHIIRRRLPIDMDLVQKKSKVPDRAALVAMIFSNARKVYSHWETDLTPLVRHPVPFRKVMDSLKEFFAYSKSQ